MTAPPANHQTAFQPRLPKLGAEAAVALAGTVFSAVLLILTAVYAGPLWRDEANTLNLAQMPSMREFWDNLTFESFPPLWPLLVRGCGILGLAGSDESIRLLGLYVGFFFLVSLWLWSRWTGGRAPILSLALLGGLPAFIFIVGANRAYGLGSGLLVLSFGMIWRMVEVPTRGRMMWAGLVCLLFAQCVYYDVVFLCAMLSGAALVVIRRREWRTLWALVGIGAVSGASLVVYLPIIRRGSVYVLLNQEPTFSFSTLWHKLGEAVTARSSAYPAGPNGPEIWLWVLLLLGGAVVALLMQRARSHPAPDAETALITRTRSDLALFCVVSMFLGTVGYMVFLMELRYSTSKWYYIEMLCLCAVSLDGILGATRPALRPWGLLRMGLMVVLMAWMAGSAWEEAHTRRSNVDLIAEALGQQASEQDLIVMYSPWEGITFDRYYHGRTRWLTLPEIDSHKVHRNDLVLEQMNQPDPMAPILREISETLRSGNNVWLVGHVTIVHPKPLPPPPSLPDKKWIGTYFAYWSAQVTSHLLDHALQEKVLEVPVAGPVSCLEYLPVACFSGNKSDAN